MATKFLLIVDDSYFSREGLATVLRRDGYEVLLATNGAEALAILGKVQIGPILGNTTDLRRLHPLRCVSIPGRFAQRLFTHETAKPEQF